MSNSREDDSVVMMGRGPGLARLLVIHEMGEAEARPWIRGPGSTGGNARDILSDAMRRGALSAIVGPMDLMRVDPRRVDEAETVGVCTPSTAKWFVREFKKRVKPIQLSWHGHNDFGMAVANSLAAVDEGVEIPHGCINGIGERAGNASLEEMIMALEVLYGRDTGIKIEKVFEVSKRIEELTGIPIGTQKPLVGTNAYSHESGIHTHGILKHTLTYEPIMPEMIGRKREFVFGKHTGTTSVEEKLKDSKVEFTPEQVKQLTELIKLAAEGKTKADYSEYIAEYHEREHLRRGVSDGEFWKLAGQVGLKRDA